MFRFILTSYEILTNSTHQFNTTRAIHYSLTTEIKSVKVQKTQHLTHLCFIVFHDNDVEYMKSNFTRENDVCI